MSRIGNPHYTVIEIEGDECTYLRSFMSTDPSEALAFFLKTYGKYDHILISRCEDDAWAMVGEEYIPKITPELRDRLAAGETIPLAGFVMQMLDYTLS